MANNNGVGLRMLGFLRNKGTEASVPIFRTLTNGDRRLRPSSYLQTKFEASSLLPLPLYEAVCGYGQTSRVRVAVPLVRCDATIESGALPCSTHCSRAASLSKLSVPSPPWQ